MSKLIIPKNYTSRLNMYETQKAIKDVKDTFQNALADGLNLRRVSAPLFVDADSGLNDNLNGTERPVSFDVCGSDKKLEIVHSLAKWKRLTLRDYGFSVGEGLYTDMNAIRRDEITDNLHSYFVDQWDWEKIIERADRNTDTLKSTVRSIYSALRKTEEVICDKYGFEDRILPSDICFVSARDLENEMPGLSPKEREYAAAKKYGAVFIMNIGCKLPSGAIHDGRAPDYDDWELNGDIMVYYPLLDIAFEISSMGIRVDEESLVKQLEERGCLDRLSLPFHKALMEHSLPYTIGGGIGQSRICMLFLRKAHIGEVQSSYWSESDRKTCAENGIVLL